MEQKRYLVLLTAVAAASYGLGEADLLTAQAKSINYVDVVEMDLGAGAGNTLDAFMAAQFCPQVEATFALPAETCDGALLDAQPAPYNLSKRDSDGDGVPDKWHLLRSMRLPGQFVPD